MHPVIKYSDIEEALLSLKEEYNKSLKRSTKESGVIYISGSAFMKFINSMTSEDIETAINKYIKNEMGYINNASKTGIDEDICK